MKVLVSLYSANDGGDRAEPFIQPRERCMKHLEKELNFHEEEVL